MKENGSAVLPEESLEIPVKRGGFGAKKGERRTLTITPMRLETMAIKVRGITALIVHKFGEKSRRQMLDSMTVDPSKPKPKRKSKDPFSDFCSSLYVLPGKSLPKKALLIGESWPSLRDTFGVPSVGFKKGMVYAAQRYAMAGRDAESAVRVMGDLVAIQYEKLTLREDSVSVGSWPRVSKDLRYRGEFSGWSAEFVVEYDADIISPETIVNLVNRAGRVAGICEWRPSAGKNPGTFGCYEVDLGRSK